MANCKENIRVICCGNAFRGDDAAGLEVFKLLEKEKFPCNVEIIEGGILGINLLHLFEEGYKIILVDSVLMDRDPGHLQWVPMADILEDGSSAISSHEINPAQLMMLWYQLKGEIALLNVFLLGIVILEPVQLTDKISSEIKQSALKAVNEIKNKIRSFAIHETC